MRSSICGLALLLAACAQQESGEENRIEAEEPEAVQPPVVEVSNDTVAAGNEVDQTQPGSLPPPDAELRFVGRWAAEARLCGDMAWRFTETSLNTPAGSQCRFTDVREVPGGYDIAARCTAEGPEGTDRITLRFAESARAMLFESEMIADAGLVFCGK